jgi:hypothetical protein
MSSDSEQEAMTDSAAATASEEPKPEQKARARQQKPHGAPAKGKSGKKGTVAKKAPQPPGAAKGAKAPKAQREQKPGAAREGSKAAKILALLGRPAGATLKDMVKATGWQPHSVRGFLSTAGKKMDRKVESAKREDGERVYSLAK